ADEHDLGFRRAFAEDGLRPGFPERAGFAAGSGLLQFLERRGGRDQRWGAFVEQVPLGPRDLGYPWGGDTMRHSGAVAEWLGRGLQSLVHQFDSGRRLDTSLCRRPLRLTLVRSSGE